MDCITLVGKDIDKILGRGSVALVTDEVLVAMIPTRINGVDNCISIKIHDTEGCCNVYPGMPKRRQMSLVRELDMEGCDFVYLTMPQCHRTLEEGWTTAADMLDRLAHAARAQAIVAAGGEVK